MTITQNSRQISIHVALAVAGMIVWIVISILTGKKEPWDSDEFWSYGLGAMLALNAAAGFADPRSPAMKGIISVSLQPVAMILMSGEIGSMLPLGLIVFVVLGLMYSFGAFAAAFIKDRFFSTNISGGI